MSYQLASNPDCGKVFTTRGAMIRSYKHHRIDLDVSPKTRLRGGFAENECGEDPTTGIHDLFSLNWPTPPALEPAQTPLPPGKLFGRQREFRFLLRNSDVGHAATRHSDYTAPGSTLSAEIDEASRNIAVVRLIRTRR